MHAANAFQKKLLLAELAFKSTHLYRLFWECTATEIQENEHFTTGTEAPTEFSRTWLSAARARYKTIPNNFSRSNGADLGRNTATENVSVDYE